MTDSRNDGRNHGVALAPVIIAQPRLVHEGGVASFSATVHIGNETKQIWFRAAQERLVCSSNSLLAATLFPAMCAGRSLQIDAPVSPRLLQNATAIQRILRSWDARYREVIVNAAPARTQEFDGGQGVACFFTGGLDSFYTALKNQSEITHLVFVHGFDVPLENLDLRARVSQSLREVAAKLQKPLIEIETNLRQLSDRYVHWELYHGAALAAVGHLLTGQLHKIYIAASRSYADIVPLGSHPLLDPLWSTESVEFIHDGCEATRIEKAAFIAKDDTALKHLRVCWENRDGAYNCGECEKCLRTMASLRTVGALAACAAFRSPLDLKTLARLHIEKLHRAHFEANLRVLESSGSDPELADALGKCLRRLARKDVVGRVIQKFRSRLNLA